MQSSQAEGRGFETRVRGEFESALEPIAADVEFDLTNQPDGQVFVGHDGLWRGMRKWMSAWDDYEMELEGFIDAGDKVLIPFRERGRGRRSGAPIGAKPAAVWTLRGGKVVHMRPFTHRDEALAAVGLSE